MPNFLRFTYDPDDPNSILVFDEVSLWAASSGRRKNRTVRPVIYDDSTAISRNVP